MLPTREQAKLLLKEAEKCNPGPWGDHSRTAAHCAERIARACGDLDPDKAYILGLLHDIGRRFGVRHLGHVSDGYSYMMSLGYDEAARICLTHSFHNQTLNDYIGRFDTSEEELELIRHTLASITMDDYDRLIQLCDSLAGAEGVVNMEERMEDVRNRYGSYPQEKWDRNLELRRYFEEKMGKDVYIVTEKETFRPYLDPLKEKNHMYITEKYWENYIGDTDDSLTLVEYLAGKQREEIPLCEILSDFGLDKLHDDFRQPDIPLAYTDPEGWEASICYAIDLITDLAALLLECKVNGSIDLCELSGLDPEEIAVPQIRITATPAEHTLIDRTLSDFASDPLSYDLSEMCPEEDMREMAALCEELRKELYE